MTARIRIPATLFALAVSSAAFGAQAATRYEYTGNPFTFAAPPYTTSDRVTGQFTTFSALPPNRAFGDVAAANVAAFSFSDGVQTIDDGNATFYFVRVSTDGNGDIVQWDIRVQIVAGTSQILTGHTGPSGDQVVGGGGIAQNIDQPGTWTSELLEVPSLGLPALAAFGVGLAAIAIVALRRRRSFA